MQAGVVAKKPCKSNYKCGTCPFDRALKGAAEANIRLKQKGAHPKGKRGKVIFWKDKLKALPPWKQPCLHSMKGKIDFRACTQDTIARTVSLINTSMTSIKYTRL